MAIQYRCYRKNFGYVAKKQDYGSIYLTFTEDPSKAKIYKTKQSAARAHNFRSWQSEKAKEELVFEEVEAITRASTIPGMCTTPIADGSANV